MGSPVRLLKSNTNTFELYNYDEFGNDLIGNVGENQPFGFTGYVKDINSGTYFSQAREYQTEDGRFISEDWINGNLGWPEELNRYGYCYNKPLTYVDSNGKFAILATMAAGAVIGGLIGGGGSIISDLYHGRDVDFKKAGGNALKGAGVGALVGTGVGAAGALAGAGITATAGTVTALGTGTAAATTTAIVNTMQISAGIGASITGITEVASQIGKGEELDFVKIGIKETEGASSGFLMGSPLGRGASIAGNALISIASSLAYDAYDGNGDYIQNALINGTWGAIGGWFGGAGAYFSDSKGAYLFQNILLAPLKENMYSSIGADIILKNMTIGVFKMLGTSSVGAFVLPKIVDFFKQIHKDSCQAVK